MGDDLLPTQQHRFGGERSHINPGKNQIISISPIHGELFQNAHSRESTGRVQSEANPERLDSNNEHTRPLPV
jgi:hypothetical protein